MLHYRSGLTGLLTHIGDSDINKKVQNGIKYSLA
jgi:hypothetical protein